MPKPWKCRECGAVNVRTASRICSGCGKPTKRNLPKRKTDAVLRDTAYADYAVISVLIHGGEPHACGCCGKPRPESRRWDRDHDHGTGRPRGLACGGNQGCNMLMLPWVTPAVATLVAEEYHDAGNARQSARWFRVANYLRRVDAFYARHPSPAAAP